eukprot:328722-Pyramimonas_sp.AAC.1
MTVRSPRSDWCRRVFRVGHLGAPPGRSSSCETVWEGKAPRGPKTVRRASRCCARCCRCCFARKVVKAKSGDVFALEYTTDGPHCWYCLRVYDSRYKTEYPKVANFVTKYVEVHAIHEQFTKYSAWLVQKILDWVEEGNDREL